jgi:hypothetical protein
MERLLGGLLKGYLEEYVTHFDREQLEVGLWSGNVALDDLELKDGALAGMGLPVSVLGGSVQRLRISVPWKNLGSEPIRLELEGLELLLAPPESHVYDPDAEAAAAYTAATTAITGTQWVRVGMNRWAVRKGWCRGQERDCFILQYMQYNTIRVDVRACACLCVCMGGCVL